MQRFFLTASSFSASHVQIQDQEALHQMQKVLRLRTGDPLICLDGSGKEYFCTLENLSPKEARAIVQEVRQNQAESHIQLRLYQALPKKMALFEWVLEKGTEIGVSEFVPLITKRTEREDVPKRERLEKILKESAEQSERGKIPKLLPMVLLADAVKEAPGYRILLHSREHPAVTETNSLKAIAARHESAYSLFIGPEGGFTEEEVQVAKEAGVRIVHLGPRILRTETAGLVAATLLLFE